MDEPLLPVMSRESPAARPPPEVEPAGSGDEGDDDTAPLLPPPPRGALHALRPPSGARHPLAPPPPTPPLAPPPPAPPPARPQLDRRHVARVIVRAALTSDVAVGAAAVARVLQALLCAAVLLRSRRELCDNADLLRVWLAFYAGRCGALAHLLYRRHGLYRRGAAARAGGANALHRLRLRAEHAKSRLDSLGTVWFVMGSLWLFGSVDCAAEAPQLTRLVFTYLVLGFASLFVPIAFFGALVCCLPPALALLNAVAPALGLRPDAAGMGGAGDTAATDDAYAWIAALPCHAFAPAPPPDAGDAESGAGSADVAADGGGASAQATSSAQEAPPESPTRSESGSEGGSEAPARGGYVGKRYVAAEDASCVICLGVYPAGRAVRQLPGCSHHFHQGCIDTWLRVNPSCPLCKAGVGPGVAARAAGGADQEEDPATAREAYLRAAVRGGDDLLSVLV